MRSNATFVAVVAVAMAMLTWLLGWWGVLLGALVAGAVFRGMDGVERRVALAASLGWAGLLAIDAASGPLAVVATTLAAVTRVPAVVLVLVTLLFPAGLAWSAATVAAMRPRRGSRTG